MVQGMYTASSGMLVQQYRLETISNNLSNALTTGYKRDVSIDKAFPEMLLRRRDEHTVKFPYRMRPSTGSIDKSPVVGKLGTGVEQNEIFTVQAQGSLIETNNPADIAISGEGFFVVDTPHGERYTRNGNFIIGGGNILMTKEGYPVVGENGYLRLQHNNFKVDESGRVVVNQNLANSEFPFVDTDENSWEGESIIDQLKLVDFEFPRYLQKQGNSLYNYTEYVGELYNLERDIERPGIEQGFLESSNVEPIRQMVEMIEVNRAYEAGQKAMQSADESTNRLLSIRM